ncbi:hypothetical protein FCH28_15460 [Streptomyces piniterrae]|uniref:DUF6545 domain-containing protein n=1 Tax=Streptomyces piniterrae TaxID=2571125 RepID=A0A4U0NJP1_9ACTN|nr:MAB_1171c family putative transporter [Streptomyces piniterrae]TJZ54511.1 hypothetical protein FCH28_15460 [Streptomyces piniterrae]
MKPDPAEFGQWLQTVGAICLWGAVLVRLPSAVRSRSQRGLWLAVATAATAMTLNLSAVQQVFRDSGESIRLIQITTNFFGVLSAGAVLFFVTMTVGGRRFEGRLYVAMGMAFAALAALLWADGSSYEFPLAGTDPAPTSIAYRLILVTAHLTANTACVSMCWRYGRSTAPPLLRSSLRLFGLGTALAGVYWVGHVVRLFTSADWIPPVMAIIMGAHALLRAMAILVPTFATARRAIVDIGTVWRLWPLWRDLMDAVPQVALTKTRPRILEILWPLVPWRLLAYRKVIETRDAIVVLRGYVEPGTLSAAREFVAGADIPEPRTEAAVLACVMREARRRKLAGLPHKPSPTEQLGIGSGDFADEKAFLLQATQEYESPLLKTFGCQLDTIGWVSDRA